MPVIIKAKTRGKAGDNSWPSLKNMNPPMTVVSEVKTVECPQCGFQRPNTSGLEGNCANCGFKQEDSSND